MATKKKSKKKKAVKNKKNPPADTQKHGAGQETEREDASEHSGAGAAGTCTEDEEELGDF